MLIAAAGFAGAGKSTALRYLASTGAGDYYYVGGIVTREVEKLGLEATPENERRVRTQLREQSGMAALAQIAESDLRERLETAPAVLIDAICNIEEAQFYRDRFQDRLVIVAVQTSFEKRAERLALRAERKITRDELTERDRYEFEDLRIGRVIDAADHCVGNDGDRKALEQALDGLAKGLLA